MLILLFSWKKITYPDSDLQVYPDLFWCLVAVEFLAEAVLFVAFVLVGTGVV